jgi:hypothetical protein
VFVSVTTSGTGSLRQFVSKATRAETPRVAFWQSVRPAFEIASDFYTGREMELFALVPVVSVYQV